MKYLFIVIALLMGFTSCRTSTKVVEVPVEVIKKEYVHDLKIDSVYIKDSIDRWHSGDTLYIAKWHTKYKYLYKTDTVYRTDTVPKIVTKAKVVEVNHIYGWQRFLMWLGGIGVALLIGFIIFKIKGK